MKTAGYSEKHYREFPSPEAARMTFALRRSRLITRPRLKKWALSTIAGSTSAAARSVRCSPFCALFHQSPASALTSPASSRAKLSSSSRQFREGCGSARALRVLPRLGSCARRDRELFAALLWPDLLVARTRQANLAAVLGGATRTDSFAAGGMAGAESAWDAFRGRHVHGGAPPQL